MAEQARRVADALTAGGWTRGATLQMLGLDLAVFSDDEAVVGLVDECYLPLRSTRAAAHVLSLGRAVVDGRPGFVVALDGLVVVRTPAPNIAFAHLLFEANQQVIERTEGAVLLHAAAAVAGARAIVLAGPMGAGKSTLVAGLAARGLAYVTDEVVAIDADDRTVRPYPKPLSLGIPPEELAGLRWEPPAGAVAYLGGGGLIPAPALPTPPATEPVAPGLVVLPRYEPGAPVEVERLAAGDALAAVAAHTFHLERPGMLRALAGVLAGVPCYRLVGGDLTGSVDAVLELADRVGGSA